MTYYFVTAAPIEDKLDALRQRLDSGEIQAMLPFGKSLHTSLINARRDDQGVAMWEEIDFCRPPLAMERSAVLDDHFTDLNIQEIASDGDGWAKIDDLPSLWPEDEVGDA